MERFYLLFAGTLLITLLLHFAAGIYLLTKVIDNNMGDSAIRIAQQAVEQEYAGLGYTVIEFTPALKAMTGSSPLVFVDFPYQALYWRLSGFTRFAAPVDIGFGYTVLDQYGHFVKSEVVRYYVLGVNRLVQSHLPLPG